MAGSGDKQTLAKLRRAEIDEVAVAFGPPAGCEVVTEAPAGRCARMTADGSTAVTSRPEGS